jgi:hypothetical protein
MSLNTIPPLRPEDFDHGRVLRQRLLDGTITVGQAYELERILENERHAAIREGNLHVLAAINYFLNRLEAFLARHNKKRRLSIIPFKVSNI